MTAEIIARAVLVAGALLLVIGPGLQARLEMREFHELLDALRQKSDLPAATRAYLSVLAVGPSMALHSPVGALEFVMKGPSTWYRDHRRARAAFSASSGGGDERVVEIRTHLLKARNWAIVMLGSVLIFAGTSAELVRTIVTGHAE
jgi:hypothetical protein